MMCFVCLIDFLLCFFFLVCLVVLLTLLMNERDDADNDDEEEGVDDDECVCGAPSRMTPTVALLITCVLRAKVTSSLILATIDD